MHKDKTPEEFIMWATKQFKQNHFEFTVYMTKYIKTGNPKLYYETIKLLESGNYDIKFLSTAATS